MSLGFTNCSIDLVDDVRVVVVVVFNVVVVVVVVVEGVSKFFFGVVATSLYFHYHFGSSPFEPLVNFGVNFSFDILSTLFSCAQSSPLYLQDIVATENK